MPRARAALALRARVLARRHGTPLDALLVLGTIVLAWLAGRTLAQALGERPGAFALLALAVALPPGALLAHRSLYRARELPLLLAQPLSARDLVLVRLVELSAAALVVLALLAALLAGASPEASVAGAVLATVLAAPLVASAQLLLAWLFRIVAGRSPWPGRALVATAALLATGGVVLGLLSPGVTRDLALAVARPLEDPLLPGGAFAALVSGHAAPGLALAGWAALASALALALVPLRHGELLDAAAGRPARALRLAFPVLAVFTFPLPRASGAMVRRDVALLLRGAFARGVLVLLGLPLGLVVFAGAANDPRLEPDLARLAAVMTAGALASVTSFLFGIDFPRVRLSKLVLERAQPVRGRDVLIARTFEAAVPGVLLALGLAWVASRGRPAVADEALDIALAAALLALACAHHGAAFGMRGEAAGAAGDFIVSAGFPVSAGFLALVGAIAFTISPWLALAYPLIYGRAGSDAALAWERAEAPPGTLGA
jgi:hypothetical protein